MARLKRKGFLLLICILSAVYVQGQTYLKDFSLNIIPPDPEAASLSTYGNYNLNLSSGQVDISVPLGTVKGNTMDYPVSLSYDHSGIKADERATCAGMNWNFNGIGMISRTVVGQPDESPGTGYNYLYQDAAYLNTSMPPLFYLNSSASPYDQLLNPQSSTDFQPDIYSFNFMGHGGKFFRDPATGTFYTVPYSKLKIETVTGTSNGNYFNITDEKGYKYQFHLIAVTQTQTDCEPTDVNSTANSYPGQWYLTEVDAPNGNVEYTFEYTGNALTNDVTSKNTTMTYLMYTNNPGVGCGNCPLPIGYTVYPLQNTTYCITSMTYNGMLLSKIHGPLQDLSVNYGSRTDGSLRIDNIQLRGKDNTLQNQWNFYHGYYNSGTTGKLRLDSIALFSVNGRESAYIFAYNGNAIPARYTNGQDFWGYNNGVTSNANLVPKVLYNNQYVGSANRSPDFTSAQQGILTQIGYPTGGNTSFEYELNDYGKIGNVGASTSLVNNAVWVNAPTITLSGHSYEAATTNDPVDKTTTFTITDATVAHIYSSRSKSDMVPCNRGLCDPPCSSGSCSGNGNECLVSNTLTCSNCTIPLSQTIYNSPVGSSQSWDIMLYPGTYTLKLHIDSWQSGAEYNQGTISVSYKKISEYVKNMVAMNKVGVIIFWY